MPESRYDYTPEEEQQLEAELHRQLTDFIAGESSLHELRHWLTHRSWRVNPGNQQIWGLYAITRARIMAFDQEDWTQDQLRDSLAVHLAWFRDEQLSGPDPMAPPSTDAEALAALAAGTLVPVRTWRARSAAELETTGKVNPEDYAGSFLVS